MSRRIGILGGTFDPIHGGHIDLASAAQAALKLTRVFVIPSNIPPHRGQPQASSFHRFAMVAMAVAGRPGWRASDLELRSDAPSYTFETLQHVHARGYAARELFFLTGADAFIEIETWKNAPAVLDLAHFVVVSRPGHQVAGLRARMPVLAGRMQELPLDIDRAVMPMIILIEATTADVSSTAIRQRRAAGEPLAGLVDARVQQHIEQHGLYTSGAPGRRGNDEDETPAAGRLHGQG
jgi:nicotinate-nucleotide adenylyltransferase